LKEIHRFVHQWAWILLVSFCIIGLVYPIMGVGALICMLAPVVVAFFKGRKWCGNYCPRGSFNDIVLSKLTLKRRIPSLFKRYWFRITFLVIVMSGFAIQLAWAWGNIIEVGQVFARMIIITTLLAIILGVMYNQRTWCLICPMGTMAHFVVKMESVKRRLNYITFIKEKCVDCKLCTQICPINIDVHSYKREGKVTSADCLKCVSCVEKCPKNSLYMA
jgi:ferredoxin-type protein NapH